MGECPVDPMRMRFDSIMKLDQKSKVKSQPDKNPDLATIQRTAGFPLCDKNLTHGLGEVSGFSFFFGFFQQGTTPGRFLVEGGILFHV